MIYLNCTSQNYHLATRTRLLNNVILYIYIYATFFLQQIYSYSSFPNYLWVKRNEIP